jgi:hypothetical protein
MNWNPYKRIADLEQRIDEMYGEMLQGLTHHGMRLRALERDQAADLLTPEEAQAQADKRVRANAAARRYYAKRKAAKP